jgi:hypothetical protein
MTGANASVQSAAMCHAFWRSRVERATRRAGGSSSATAGGALCRLEAVRLGCVRSIPVSSSAYSDTSV